MEFKNPNDKDFTVYSRSGCHYCTKVKQLLKSKEHIFSVVDCDEYILEDRDNFLNYMKELAKKEIKGFPMVFHNKYFIGGYIETKDYINKLNVFNEIDDF